MIEWIVSAEWPLDTEAVAWLKGNYLPAQYQRALELWTRIPGPITDISSIPAVIPIEVYLHPTIFPNPTTGEPDAGLFVPEVHSQSGRNRLEIAWAEELNPAWRILMHECAHCIGYLNAIPNWHIMLHGRGATAEEPDPYVGGIPSGMTARAYLDDGYNRGHQFHPLPY